MFSLLTGHWLVCSTYSPLLIGQQCHVLWGNFDGGNVGFSQFDDSYFFSGPEVPGKTFKTRRNIKMLSTEEIHDHMSHVISDSEGLADPYF